MTSANDDERRIASIEKLMEEYPQRQAEIDRLLTPTVVKRLVDEKSVADEITKHLNGSEAKEKRVVLVVYPSISCLLRKIKQEGETKDDKAMFVAFQTLTEARKNNPTIKTLAVAKPNDLCFIICTWQVTGRVLTHTFTCMTPRT